MNPHAKVALFSATYPEDVKDFAEKIATDAVKITLKPFEVMLKRIHLLQCHTTETYDKYKIVQTLFKKAPVGQCFIFTNTIRTCEELTKRLEADEFPVSKLHRDLDHEDRDRVIDTFKKGKTRVLVTTNVVARGIDVLQVSLVINYDVPTKGEKASEQVYDAETFIHRVGRTARFGRSGVALTLISDEVENERFENILCDIGAEAEDIKPEELREIPKRVKQCRALDEENLRKNLGLATADIPDLSGTGEALVLESRKTKHANKKSKTETAPTETAPVETAPVEPSTSTPSTSSDPAPSASSDPAPSASSDAPASE